jgi:hypothetical protein
MRIPFPDRISLAYVAVFASLVCVVEQIEGTGSFFSICVFLFIFLAGVAFNIAGGFSRVSGAYVFFFATLGSIVGWVMKDILGERADSNLQSPNLTAAVYLGTMVSLTVAVFLSKKITTKRALLARFLTDDNVRTSVVGCTVVGFAVSLLLVILPHAPGSVLSFLSQLNNWAPLAVIIGVTYEVRRSGGTRSLTPTILVAMGTTFFFTGLVGFSKEGLFTPFLCYLVAASSVGYRFSRKQIGVGLAVTYFMLHFMVPYSQYGRQYRTESEDRQAGFAETLGHVEDLLSNLSATRSLYRAQTAEREESGQEGGYFNQSQGLFDRLHMFGPDDSLVTATAEGKNLYGLYPLWYSVYNAVPHFLWPNKPVYMFGNLYAHEIGGIAEDNFGTGISFSPAGQAFHMAQWIGVLLVAPPVFIACFAFFDSLCGDVRSSPWGLLAVALFAHVAPEDGLEGCITSIWHFGIPLIAAALICAYVMPILGAIIIGPQKRHVELSSDLRFPRDAPAQRGRP